MLVELHHDQLGAVSEFKIDFLDQGKEEFDQVLCKFFLLDVD